MPYSPQRRNLVPSGIALFFFLHLLSCRPMMNDVKTYPYTTVPGDSLHTRIYTLGNGLTVFMSPYRDEPRIYTSIAVRAGSKNDPAETTGLAHYLEHMLFKGTDSIGALNYEKEHAELEKIINLYEEYRTASDPDKRAAIYRDIDSISNVAARYTVPNEYDKLLNSIGAQGTNAYTWVEQTVYINDIPSNKLDQWLTIEAERFRNPVMRLFHTELETVYEEKNMTMDSDSRKIWENLFSGLFRKHTYGTQTTIGEAEHLKNPSIRNVINYYRSYYVPNNMALCIAGDFDPDETIRMIDEKFSVLEAKEIPLFTPAVEEQLQKPVITKVKGPEAEELVIGYRFSGVNTRDADYLTMIDKVLYNQTAGLIDLNLNQQQKTLDAGSMLVLMKDYSAHLLSAKPREGQSLDEVRNLLLEQIEQLKKGNFPDWLLEAAVNDLKIEQLKLYESNKGRVEAYVDSFIWGMDWSDYNSQIERLSAITKDELTAFAKAHYATNYVAVYKEHGSEKSSPKIQKPPITPIKVNRDTSSLFAGNILAKKSENIEPTFLDYRKDIGFYDVKPGIRLHYLQNNENDLFSVYYVFDIGKNHSRKIDLALDYLSYLGTSALTPAEFSQELYKNGASFSAFTSDDYVYLKLSGLKKNFPAALRLLEQLLSDTRPDEAALEKLKAGTMKERADDKLSKRKILFEAMASYGKYGPSSPFTNVLSNAELEAISSKELLDEIKNLMQYRHRVLYYGPDSAENLLAELRAVRGYPATFREVPSVEFYPELEQRNNLVYVVDYDMTQAEVIMLTRDDSYNSEMVPLVTLFNEYYGGGMSSVVFQELREAKALAYSVLSVYRMPKFRNRHSYLFSYIGTQADKLPEALDGISSLMHELPESPELFASAKEGIMQKISTERLTRSEVLFNYEDAQRLELDDDIRKNIYRDVPSMTLQDVKLFHQQHFGNRNHVMLVLGDTSRLDMDTLRQYGTVKELKLDELFGY
ncbi:MAG: insulinase family protein [Chlorobium limicola]|uniref:Peptidase M16 domain protein n=1 Tax=Chlorobium limicola (strain DSM 245 / NBRC 103803 / 6330) TaxID=290315 RepID=B3EFX0_CHLL2|nr:peptidase M16 domain protein [Chlorobium limicola DSM 245]NTV21312.1 insulinase family protein [Chlorobium limicola]